MKKKAKLVLAKETLRALTQKQLIEINGREGTFTTTLDFDCYHTTPSFFQCP